jgi:hypothetical protein
MVFGDSVTISGSASQYNGIYSILNTVTTDTFQVTISSYNGSSSVGIAFNNSYAKFDPDSNISKFFGAQVKFGTAAGRYVTYTWDKLQIKDVKEGKVGSFLGRSVSFRNTGKSRVILE